MTQIQYADLPNYLTNKKYIIGCDECGYGAWAGDLVVCGVKVPISWNFNGLKDSKKLSPLQREKLNNSLVNSKFDYFIVRKSNIYIDKIGVGLTLKQCYVEIFKHFYTPDSLIITDGILNFKDMGVDTFDKVSLVKADNLVPAVMAASIIGKYYRDSLMKAYHKQYPYYYWDSNMGYGASVHKEAIIKYGFTSLHRMSYKIKLT